MLKNNAPADTPEYFKNSLLLTPAEDWSLLIVLLSDILISTLSKPFKNVNIDQKPV